MPVSFSFESHIVVIRPEGDYTPVDLKQALLTALDDPACPPSPYGLLDLTESTVLLSRSSAQIIDMAEFLLAQRPRLGHKQAIVVAGTAAFGLVRMGSVYATVDNSEPRVFRSLDEARAWLMS